MNKVIDQHDKQLAHAESLQMPGTLRNLGMLIAPAAMRTRLKYTSRVPFVSTIGVVGVHNFSANGLFDVDVTGVGGQPEGFDEWMAMYVEYRVISTKITVKTGSTGSTSATASFWMVIVPSNIPTSFTTMEDAASAPFAVSKLYMSGGPAITLTQTMSTATIVGVPPMAILSESGYGGTASANPAGTTFWGVYVESADNSSSVTTNSVVSIEYVVDFYDRDNFAISLSERAAKNASLRENYLKDKEKKKRIAEIEKDTSTSSGV
jgi:hypothetical protein